MKFIYNKDKRGYIIEGEFNHRCVYCDCLLQPPFFWIAESKEAPLKKNTFMCYACSRKPFVDRERGIILKVILSDKKDSCDSHEILQRIIEVRSTNNQNGGAQ